MSAMRRAKFAGIAWTVADEEEKTADEVWNSVKEPLKNELFSRRLNPRAIFCGGRRRQERAAGNVRRKASKFCFGRAVVLRRGEQLAADLIEVAQGKEQEEPGGVLGHAAVAHARMASELFDDPKRKLHFAADGGFFPVGAFLRGAERPIAVGLVVNEVGHAGLPAVGFENLVGVAAVPADHLLDTVGRPQTRA